MSMADAWPEGLPTERAARRSHWPRKKGVTIKGGLHRRNRDSCAGCAMRQANAYKRAKPKTGEVCILKVSGMFCGACAKTVEKTAKKIDGVKSAKVSQPKGTAEITYDPAKTSPEAIAKAITEKTPFTSEVPQKR